jgi:DNA-binding NarL/FixJ family response regulator
VAATKVAVQHSDQLIRSGLRIVLDGEPDIEVVAESATPSDLVDDCGDHRPDVVVLEVDAATWDAPRLAAALRKRQRTLRVVGLFEALPPDTARRAYRAGVRALVDCDGGASAVLAALRGGSSRPVPVVRPLPATTPDATLTPREVEIVQLIAGGMLTREIARTLGISAKTVENHKQRLFRKLDVQNQAHAVSVAIRRGLLQPSVLARRA